MASTIVLAHKNIQNHIIFLVTQKEVIQKSSYKTNKLYKFNLKEYLEDFTSVLQGSLTMS